MKKIFVVLMLLVVVFAFGESYEFDGDTWNFSKTTEDGSYIASFWIHDLENSVWTDMDPHDWGLLQTAIGIGKDFDTGEVVLVFIYKTSIKYSLPNFIVCSNENDDSYLLGGKCSNNDYSDCNSEEEGIYTSIIIINLTEEDIEYLDKDRYFSIIDSKNGHNIYYGVPEEIFNVSFNILGMR